MRLIANFLGEVNSKSSRSDQECISVYRNLVSTYQRAVSALSQTSVQVSQLRGMTAIAVGVNHSCAIVQGYVYCWGDNDWGQLGDGTLNSSAIPVQVKGMAGATGITVGNKH